MKKKILIPHEWRIRDTQHSDRCWWWLASLFMAAMLAVIAIACTEELIQPIAEEPEGLPATIRLEILPDATTQAQTRADSQIDESGIKDLHILVYNSAGELIGKSYGVHSTAEPSFTVKTHSGKNNTIYAIANTGNEKLFDGTVAATETKLKAMETPALKKWDELTTASHLVMVGCRTGVVIKAGSDTLTDAITVTRITAKITLNISVKAGSGITIKSYQVFSLPKQSYFVSNTADAATTWISDSTSTTVNAVSASKTFFMYENRRGKVESITEQKDKGANKAPNNASYVVIKGKSNGYDATWRVYLGENSTSDFNIKRNGKYTYHITLNRPDVDGVDTRIVEEISNCYMMLPGSTITIPVIRANESFIKLEGSTYNSTTKTYDQLQSSTKWTASLIWETSIGLVTLSENTGTGPSGRFKITAKNAQGNAVVAIKNASNQILWSWHIWVTTYDGSTHFINNNGSRSVVFMDRALGATSAASATTAEQLASCGLMYQWGRKDPFPSIGQSGGSWSVSNYTDPIRVYNASGAPYEITKTLVPNVTPNNLTNAIRSPDIFYYNTNSPYDWFVYNSPSAQNNDLWSSGNVALGAAVKKSVFDPCPAGWRVPPWLNNVSPFAKMNSGWSWNNYGQNWSGTGGYFPASGLRDSGSGMLYYIRVYGYCWSGSPSNLDGYNLYFYSEGVSPASNNYHRATGLPVRCSQE